MKILILYASVTGNAKGMARILEQFFKHAGASVTMGTMQETDPTVINDYDAVIISTYTWTGGVIPPESEDFYADLTEVDLSKRPVVFGVVGTGDPFYGADYNTAPDLFTAALRASGAVRGATTVKIEQNATEEDIPAFAAFSKAVLAKIAETTTQA